MRKGIFWCKDFNTECPELIMVSTVCDVFVLATANEMRKLPNSLVRSGRFDRKIEVQCPTDKDANEIIAHYLSSKKVSESVNMDDLSKMISYSSCDAGRA